MKTIALITVIYNNYEVLEDLYVSLKKQSDFSYHLYIADASSKKQTIDVTGIPHTVISTENKGYAHGVNVGLKQAIKDGYTEFCVMNNDIYFEKDFIKSIRTTFEKNPRSLIGGKIYYAPNYEYHDRYKTEDRGNVLWYAGGNVDWNHSNTQHKGVDEVDTGTYDKIVQTDFITGCFMCFDKKVIDTIGFWDESYFLYYEDADYCERAKRKNIPLIFNPDIVIWHKNAQSTDGSGSKLHERYQKSAHFKFGMKYAPLRTKLHLLKNRFL
ncbi:MAG: glycosyltransferase family 2 protein [bacterium]|nr:glycosyltransferase family 2 protein [bacterium]